MAKVEQAAIKAVEWFDYNGMNLNPDKCHLLVSGHKYEVMIGNIGGHKYEAMIGNIGDVQVIESSNVTLLGMMIDSSLNLDNHISIICKKGARKLSALSQQCAILSLNRRNMLMQAFIISQFSYCRWFGCYTVEKQTQKSTIYITGHCALCVAMKSPLLNNF